MVKIGDLMCKSSLSNRSTSIITPPLSTITTPLYPPVSDATLSYYSLPETFPKTQLAMITTFPLIDRPSKIAAIIFVSLVLTSFSSTKASRCYESIISFGDSLADTGNAIHIYSEELPLRPDLPPYGRTFFHHPTGRFCDGRLVIDFIAERFGLPSVPPYFGRQNANLSGSRFEKGVNFAVGGAAALKRQFFVERGIDFPPTKTLDDELAWFKKFLATVPDGRTFLQRSLVLLGEMGGNDYSYSLAQGTSIEEIKSFVPLIIQKTGLTIQELIKLGVRTILVAGELPLGCLPLYLTIFRTSDKQDYDPTTGCLNWANELTEYHNRLLRKELIRIQKNHYHVAIIYADYYNAAMRFYRSPYEFGFDNRVLKACCGGGGPYNYNTSAGCGTPTAPSCDNPSSFANWDGVHLTEAAYKLIAQGLLEGPYTIPRISSFCTSIFGDPGVYDY